MIIKCNSISLQFLKKSENQAHSELFGSDKTSTPLSTSTQTICHTASRGVQPFMIQPQLIKHNRHIQPAKFQAFETRLKFGVKQSRCAATGYTGWTKKNWTILNVDNFAMVSGRKGCDMSKVCKFCLEKSINLYSCVFKYSLPNLHKYSLSLKLH